MSLIPESVTTRDQLPRLVDVTSLNIESGSVVLMQISPWSGEIAAKAGEEVQKHLTATGKTGVLLLLLAQGASIELLDEETMASHGWYRRTEGETDEPQ